MTLKIVCNNQLRQMIYGYDLPEKVKQAFGYIEDIDQAAFVKYKGNYLYLNDFISVNAFNEQKTFKEAGFDGYTVDSAFNGLLIKLYPNDSDSVIIGQWFDH